MKNADLVLFGDLKYVDLLYIENDPVLSDYDRSAIEIALSGMGKIESLDNFRITYLFDAFCNPDAFSSFEKSENILLYTSFTGDSGSMFHNFLRGCQVKNLKNKRIFNCFNKQILSAHFNYYEKEIIEMDEKNNISFYVLPNGLFNCFAKINSKFS